VTSRSRTPERSRPRTGAAVTLPSGRAGRVLTPGAAVTPLLVALVTVAAFLPTLSNGFLDWDDDENLVANLYYRGLAWTNLRWMLTTTHMGHWIPLTWVTFGADYLIWGMNPFGYHLTSLLLHAAASVVFYFVALRLLGAAQVAESIGGLRAGAATAALFFAIHPLRVESVAWATERRDVLSGLWFLLTILLYLKAATTDGSRRAWWLAGSVGCYALAVASKAIVMTLPLVLVLLDIYPLRRLAQAWRPWTPSQARRIWAEKVPYVILALTAAGMAIYAGRPIADSLGARPVPGRMAVALYSLVFYVRKTAVPLAIWPLYQIPAKVDPLALPVVVSTLAVAALTGSLFLVRRRWPAGLTVWLSYAIILAPVSGIMQSGPQLVAPRYTYLPCLGWALLVGAGACRLLRARARGRLHPAWAAAGVMAIVLYLVSLGTLTWKQARIWHDSLTFWSSAVSVVPGSSIAQGNLGAALMRVDRLDEARTHLETAVRLSPEYVDALTNLAVLLVQQERPDEARAVFRRLGYGLLRRGKVNRAVELFRGLVDIQPTDAVAQNGLGFVLFVAGDREAAIGHFRRALEIDPNFEAARRNLHDALTLMKQ
jgi:tetratricopeptide (TPR) repeat protein